MHVYIYAPNLVNAALMKKTVGSNYRLVGLNIQASVFLNLLKN